MTEPTEEAPFVAEVRRRLVRARLHRVTKVLPAGDGYDVRILISPPDADVAARVADLCADLRVDVVEGLWFRR